MPDYIQKKMMENLQSIFFLLLLLKRYL